MKEGQLIIELYEYIHNSESIPPFEYISCPLEKCFSGKKSVSLKEIIQKSFDNIAPQKKNKEKEREFLEKAEEAGLGKITVLFAKSKKDAEPYLELTNVIPMGITLDDARQNHKKRNEIILYGRYRLTDGHNTMFLRDAQRLTLIYSSHIGDKSTMYAPEADDEDMPAKEICLNITYLQA